MGKPLILIVCTGNYCRSPMAAAILHKTLGPDFEVVSAGVKPIKGVHPLVVEALRSDDIDISGHSPRHVNEFVNCDVETVITVSDIAKWLCPKIATEKYRYHWRFDEPIGENEADEREVVIKLREEMFLVFEAYAAGRHAERTRAASPEQ